MRPATWGSMLWTIAPQAAVRRGSACYRYLDHTAVMMSLEYLILRIRHGSWMRAIAKLKTSNFGDFLRGGCERSGSHKPNIFTPAIIKHHQPSPDPACANRPQAPMQGIANRLTFFPNNATIDPASNMATVVSTLDLGGVLYGHTTPYPATRPARKKLASSGRLPPHGNHRLGQGPV